MKEGKPEEKNNKNTQDDLDSLDDALHDMEMLYKSRCVDVPLTSNVKVVEIDKEKDDDSKE